MTRSLIFAANWKMNHGVAEAQAFADKFLALTAPSDGLPTLELGDSDGKMFTGSPRAPTPGASRFPW